MIERGEFPEWEIFPVTSLGYGYLTKLLRWIKLAKELLEAR